MPFDLNDSKNRDAGFLVCKRPEWSNEEEVRLIRARGSGPQVMIDARWLTRIILGKDMTPNHRKQIREWSKMRRPELAVAQASFDGLHQEIRLEE